VRGAAWARTPVLLVLLGLGCHALGPKDQVGVVVVRPSPLDTWRAPWPEDGVPVGDHLPKRWIVVGWDAGSWEIILPLLEAGKLPHLEALMRGGAYASLLTFKPTESPAVWTSIATGVSPLRHGVSGFLKEPPPQGLWARVTRAEPPPVRLTSNADRRVRALWNLASENERSVLVVGYHNTYPAEHVRGAIVSSYLVRRDIAPAAHPTGPAADDATRFAYPPTILPTLARLTRPLHDLTYEELHPFINVDKAAFETLMAGLGGTVRKLEDDLRFEYVCKAYAFDDFHGRVALALRAEVKPDFLMIHFQSPDWASHRFLYFHDPGLFGKVRGHPGMRVRLTREREMYRGTLSAFYAFVDEWLGRLVDGRDESTAVMVLSDHGIDPMSNTAKSGNHFEAPPGMLVLSGPGIRAGHRLSRATVYDILPTLLAAVGLPVAGDLEGKVLADAFRPGVLREEAIRRTASYESGGRFVPPVDRDSGLRGEVEKELRGLGYIE
jgi:hypothetical protein